MSLGVLCIIIIPTEDEELKLHQQNVEKSATHLNTPATTITKTKTATPVTTPLTAPITPITSKIPVKEKQYKLNINCDDLYPKSFQGHRKIQTLDPNDHPALSKICENRYDTFHKIINTSPYISNENRKTTGIDNGCFEIDMEFCPNNLQNKRNKSADDLKEVYNATKEFTSKEDINLNQKKKFQSSSLCLDIPTDSTMSIVLKEIFRKLKIEYISWTKIRDDKYYQVIFTMECDLKYENLQLMLNEWGIGHRKGSSVSLVNCTFNSYKNNFDDRKDSGASEDYSAKNGGVWNRFMNNLAARLNIAQIVRDVRQDATITFDFTILVISAAILASFGLIENSTIFLTSSMLISPLMGPIIAGIFGTVIKDGPLSYLGVVNELIGLFMATLVGFIFGLVVCSIKQSYNILDDGLTIEMMSRTSLHSVSVGVITATVSGAAAAVGILGGNVGSLVGVAISASLLPPAVNAGLLWALSCIYVSYVPDEKSQIYNQIGVYSNNIPTEIAVLGLISMLLTISNIICVYVVGVIILKIKEIAPTVSNKQFWRHDIKIARDHNRNIFNDNSSLANEYAALPKNEQNVMKCLNSINLDDLQYQNTWSPGNLKTLSRNQSLQDLGKLYSATVHSSRYGGTRANSLCADKILYHLDDVSSYMRRASMPFDVLARSPKNRKSVKKLPTIEASPYEVSPAATLNKATYSKFTVTPVLDSRKSENV